MPSTTIRKGQNLKDLSFYEAAGLVIPGGAFLFGLLVFFPDLKVIFADPQVSVGGLGLFILAAYALGHFIGAIGNFLEAVVWWFAGGMPTMWVCAKKPRLLAGEQIRAVERKMKSRLNDEVEISGMPQSEWRAKFGLLYRDAMSGGTSTRIDTFNGNYGLNRGLASAMLLLTLICAVKRNADWIVWCSVLAFMAAIFTFRMCRFGIYFGREVFFRFLLLPDSRFEISETKKLF